MDCYITWASERMIYTEGGYSLNNPQNLKLYRELKDIWLESFHDTEDYIDFFLHNRFDPKRTIVAVSEDHAIGVAYLLPVDITTGYGDIPAVFGYALGIRKKYRGYAYSVKIINSIYQYCNEHKCVFTFYPANEKLVTYYESIGLEKVGNIKEMNYYFNDKEPKREMTLESIDDVEYFNLRNAFFSRVGFLKWNAAAINYAILENNFCGGFCYKLIYQSKKYAILGHLENNKLVIMEATIPSQLLAEILGGLAGYFKVKQVTIYVPADSNATGRERLWVMGYKAKMLINGYCNLLLN